MHARYAGKWFSTLSFSQRTTTYATSGRETRGIWNEYLAVPGRLRIDYLPLSEQSGVLYAGNRIHSFLNGKPAASEDGWNPLLILIADVYAQSVDTSAWQLDSLGFDVSLVRQDTVGGKAMWVVGVATADTTERQFWVDADSLLVRRVIQRQRSATRQSVTDIRLERYTDVGGYPVAFEILFHRDGRLYFKEEYFDVKANIPLAPAIFDPAQWVASQVRPEPAPQDRLGSSPPTRLMPVSFVTRPEAR
ncbi:MAG: hypothetical protein MNPFHGCM_02490 [Gemmatimonadaceae bacterium]|nr:hypothetical protein [Gemmatimonadaceae bacterium]